MRILKEICKDNHIELHTYSDDFGRNIQSLYKDLTKGFAFSDGEDKYIFFDDSLGKWERVFVATHEIGHVLMGHVDDCKICSNISIEKMEGQADLFSVVFTCLMLWDEMQLKRRLQYE